MEKYNGFVIDAAMMALMYFGLFKGNEYASNLFWPVLWVFVVLSLLIMIIFTNEKTKVEVLKDRKPRPKWKVKYSLYYDTVFSLLLAALGFAWAAGVWFIVQLIAGGCVNSFDDELRDKKSS